MIKRLVGYFFAGLASVLPLGLMGWLLYYIYNLIKDYLNFHYVVTGVSIVIIGLILLGYLTSSYIGKRTLSSIENTLIKTPILGPIYKSTKDVTNAFVGAENKFSEPVMVQFAGDLYKIGFITNKDIVELKGFDGVKDHILYSVYFPLSFSISGDLFLVPISRITPIDAKAKDVMQMIVSGGLIKGLEVENE